MATVQYGTLTFKGATTGRIYSVNLTTTDVEAAMVAMGPANNTFWNIPETGWVLDLTASNAAAGTMKTWVLLINGVRTEHKWHLGMLAQTLNYPRLPAPIGIAAAPGRMIQIQESAT
jgi:hypothetical protein